MIKLNSGNHKLLSYQKAPEPAMVIADQAEAKSFLKDLGDFIQERLKPEHLQEINSDELARIYLSYYAYHYDKAVYKNIEQIMPEVMTVKRLDHFDTTEITAMLQLSAGAGYIHPIAQSAPPVNFQDISHRKRSNFIVVKVVGDSMINARIFPGDEVLMRKSGSANDLEIIVARLDGKRIIKSYSIDNQGDQWLYSENDKYPHPMRISEYSDFEIEGVVIGKLQGVVSPRKKMSFH